MGSSRLSTGQLAGSSKSKACSFKISGKSWAPNFQKQAQILNIRKFEAPLSVSMGSRLSTGQLAGTVELLIVSSSKSKPKFYISGSSELQK